MRDWMMGMMAGRSRERGGQQKGSERGQSRRREEGLLCLASLLLLHICINRQRQTHINQHHHHHQCNQPIHRRAASGYEVRHPHDASLQTYRGHRVLQVSDDDDDGAMTRGFESGAFVAWRGTERARGLARVWTKPRRPLHYRPPRSFLFDGTSATPRTPRYQQLPTHRQTHTNTR